MVFAGHHKPIRTCLPITTVAQCSRPLLRDLTSEPPLDLVLAVLGGGSRGEGIGSPIVRRETFFAPPAPASIAALLIE